MANQVLAVNISEEVSSMSTRDGLVEGLVMTSQVSSLFRTWLCAPSPAVGMPWWGVIWEQAQIKSLSWGPTSWEGSKEEEGEHMGRGRGLRVAETTWVRVQRLERFCQSKRCCQGAGEEVAGRLGL